MKKAISRFKSVPKVAKRKAICRKLFEGERADTEGKDDPWAISDSDLSSEDEEGMATCPRHPPKEHAC